jgi:hypothetical protein
MSRILNAQAPADAAKSANYTKSQLAYSICDGRYKVNDPRTSVSLPLLISGLPLDPGKYRDSRWPTVREVEIRG